MLTATVFQPSYAACSHIFGRKPVILFALAIFTGGAIVAGLSNSFEVLILGRSLQGTGGGGILALTEIIVTDLIPLRLRGRWFAFVTMMWAFGSVSGPIIGGAFAETISWVSLRGSDMVPSEMLISFRSVGYSTLTFHFVGFLL